MKETAKLLLPVKHTWPPILPTSLTARQNPKEDARIKWGLGHREQARPHGRPAAAEALGGDLRILKPLAVIGVYLVALLGASTPSVAQSPGTPSVAQSPGTPALAPTPSVFGVGSDVLFQQVLNDPSNLDISFRYAELATQQGDYEAAIGALERMLFYNADLPRVKLELGVLYFRLGSYEMAKSYFEAAIAGPNVPPEVRSKVEAFLAEIARRTSPFQYSAFVWGGGRYQTNANAGPNSMLVRALGFDATLASQFAKQPDWNSFIFGAAGVSYDLGNQRGDTLEAGVVGYYAKQFLVDQFDLGMTELQVGPRLALFPEMIQGASLKLYGIANTVGLGGSNYFNTLGAGASSRFNLGVFAVAEPSFEYRQRQFFDSGNFPTASMQTGHLMTGAFSAEGVVPGWMKWAARAAYDRNETDFDQYTYDRWSIDVGVPFEFVTDWWGTRQWIVTPNAGFSYVRYAGPDPLVDPTVTRRDHEWRVGTIVDVQLKDNIGLRTQMQYSKNNSNLPNYTMSDFAVSFGPTLRF